MNPIRVLILSAVAFCLASLLTGQQVVPDSPAVWREVTGVIKNYSSGTYVNSSFTRPHMPAYRTTKDGRVGICVEGGGPEGSTPRFTLFMPEKLTSPFLNNAPSSYTMTGSTVKWHDGYATAYDSRVEFTGSRAVRHACIWDPTGPITDANGSDVYNVAVLAICNDTSAIRLYTTPTTIVVSNPKTASAAITSITTPGIRKASGVLPFAGLGFEPVIVGDGRLLVFRVASSSMPWTDPVTGLPGVTTGQACDVV